jgi:hypothetical protein
MSSWTADLRPGQRRAIRLPPYPEILAPWPRALDLVPKFKVVLAVERAAFHLPRVMYSARATPDRNSTTIIPK